MGLSTYRQARQSHNLRVTRGADCFHIDGRTSAAVDHQHDVALQSSRCEGITANILRLLPTMMMVDPDSRPQAWMLSEVFSQLLLMPESESTDTAQGTRILGELMSSKRPRAPRDASSRPDRHISSDTSAPTKTVRGIWVSLPERSYGPDEVAVALKSAVAQNKAVDIISMSFGFDLPDAALPLQHEDEPSNLSPTTAAALQRSSGSSSRGTDPRTSRTMISDSMASYRLTEKIIQEQLSQMFPEIPVAEFEIRVG